MSPHILRRLLQFRRSMALVGDLNGTTVMYGGRNSAERQALKCSVMVQGWEREDVGEPDPYDEYAGGYSPVDDGFLGE